MTAASHAPLSPKEAQVPARPFVPALAAAAFLVAGWRARPHAIPPRYRCRAGLPGASAHWDIEGLLEEHGGRGVSAASGVKSCHPRPPSPRSCHVGVSCTAAQATPSCRPCAPRPPSAPVSAPESRRCPGGRSRDLSRRRGVPPRKRLPPRRGLGRPLPSPALVLQPVARRPAPSLAPQRQPSPRGRLWRRTGGPGERASLPPRITSAS
mmetsp:Transcript_80790/g.234338  ORF Transcript_80790/g.234338 Transcript_80790/m.234338 type:complete len:209 (-) Transcript_80790:300-926(-)